MAHLPFLLQQSTTSLDDLQATMEEVQPLLWFTAGLFVVTLLLTAVLIFRKQNQKKKKDKKDKKDNRENTEKALMSEPTPPKLEENKATEKKETIIFEEKTAHIAERQQNASEPTIAEASLVEDEKPMDPTPPSKTQISHATKEEVTSLVDEALKETKSREENLEAIKKRLEELGVRKMENPEPTITTKIKDAQVETTEEVKAETFEEAEVIYMEAEPIFEPVIETTNQDHQEDTSESETENQPLEPVTWSISLTSEPRSTPETPPGSMLPQQIKTFADWLRDYK